MGGCLRQVSLYYLLDRIGSQCVWYCPLRYDGRAHLSDKAMFCLKPNIVRRLAKEEEDLEATLDEERYLSLNRDIMEEELMKGESLTMLSQHMYVTCGLSSDGDVACVTVSILSRLL